MNNYYNYKNFQQQSPSSKFDNIVSIIANQTNCEPRSYGKGLRLRCPAHDDNNPSFCISLNADGKILMHCFSGCTIQEICKAIGIPLKDLFPSKKHEFFNA